MKKLVSACLGLILIGTSCSKKADNSPTTQPNSDKVKYSVIGQGLDPLPFYWEESEGIGHCSEVPGICHDMSVCYPIVLSAMQQAVSGGPSGIASFFSQTSNQSAFAACGVDEDDFDNLTSGNYNIIIQVDANDPDLYYFLVGPTSTLSISNPEYVLQFKAEEE